MKSIWLNGWGIGESRLRQAIAANLGDRDFACIEPAPLWESELKNCIHSNVTVFAYSTGAFLLLARPDLMAIARRVVLFSPFTDIKAEAKAGGKIRLVQLKRLARWLRSDPLAAVQDFHARAGLGGEPLDELPLPQDDLAWGIDRLIADSRPSSSLEDCECYIGELDSLLDASTLKWLHPTINVVSGAGHGIGELLKKSGFSL